MAAKPTLPDKDARTVLKHRYTAVFMYEASVADLSAASSEPTTLLFLDFA